MNLQKGDKVKFLDEVGQGEIIKVVDKKTVIVSTEDGFEYPYSIQNLLKIEEINDSGSYEKASPQTRQEPVKQTITADSSLKEIIFEQTESVAKDNEDIDIFLAFAPQNVGNLANSQQTLFIVNDSNWHLLYVCEIKRGNDFISIPSFLQPNFKEEIDVFDPQELYELQEIKIQIIMFRKNYPAAHEPISKEFVFPKLTFTKPQKYEQNAFFDTKILRCNILEESALKKAVEKLKKEDLNKVIRDKETVPEQIKPIKKPDTVEIDLHINELLDSTKGMDKKAILEYQLDVFKKKLAENMKIKHVRKVVFIHGKGEGVLKNKIRTYMTTHNIKFQDASFKKYGYGATMAIKQ